MKLRQVVENLKQIANRGTFDGTNISSYFRQCFYKDHERGITIIFTRDSNHHQGGWWKNPDYERCYHLSLYFFSPILGCPKPKDKEMTEKLLKMFFGEDRKLLWCEPPYTDVGKRNDTWHYRLFCNEAWQPIKPRGEVYSKKFTPAGWKSYSDLMYKKEKN